jgi:voltage-gated potassium channel
MIAGTRADAHRQPYEALPRRVRRRLTLLSLLRALASCTLLVALYYLLPLDGRGGLAVGIGLAVGLLVFAALVTVQTWRIATSPYPRLRALEALATAVPLFLLMFAASYYLLSNNSARSFSEPLDRTSALYFTITVFSTVGFGDITPTSAGARIATMLQMLADLAVFGVVARVLVGAISTGLRRRPGPTGETGETGEQPAAGAEPAQIRTNRPG